MKQTKNSGTEIIFFVCFCIAGNTSFASVSIREQMHAIQSPQELFQYYTAVKNDLYKVRYFLKYVPGYLDKMGEKNAPPWLYEVVDDALGSSYDALVREAICVAGVYGMSEYAPKLEELFGRSQTRFSAAAAVLRSCIVTSLQHMESRTAVRSLSNLIQTYSRNCILSPEFTQLLTVVYYVGDTQCVKALDRLDQAARQQIRRAAVRSVASQQNPVIQDLQRIITRIDETRETILKRNTAGEKPHD
jgi:hypothetical protein